MRHFYYMIVLALCFQIQACSDLGEISGVVEDSLTDQPIADVKVTIKGTQIEVKTKKDGSYILPDVAPGNQSLLFSKEKYSTYELQLVLGKKQNLPAQTITMKPIIEVWLIGDPYKGTIPSNHMPRNLKKYSKQNNFSFELKVAAASDFSKQFIEAYSNNQAPEVIISNNYLLLEKGLETDRGYINGIGNNFNISKSLISISFGSEIFNSLLDNSFKFIVKKSANFEAAKAIVFSEIKTCDQAFKKQSDLYQAIVDDNLFSVAKKIAVAHRESDTSALSDLSDNFFQQSIDFDAYKSSNEYKVQSEPLICGVWGNNNIAFVNSIVSFSGKYHDSYSKVDKEEVGWDRLTQIFQKNEDKWRPISLSDTKGLLQKLYDEVGNVDNRIQNSKIGSPIIRYPDNNKKLPRFPKRPDIAWNHVPGAYAYMVESQFLNPFDGIFGLSHLYILKTRNKNLITIRAPFGAGAQPHRWRVWALSKTEKPSVSNWRIIDYIN